MGRSVFAVVAGYSVMAISVRVLFALQPGGRAAAEDLGFLLLSLWFGTVFAVIAGYMTALIARRLELVHAVALATLLVPMGIISIALGAEPLWYRITDASLEVLAVVLGGYARAWQVRKARAG